MPEVHGQVEAADITSPSKNKIDVYVQHFLAPSDMGATICTSSTGKGGGEVMFYLTSEEGQAAYPLAEYVASFQRRMFFMGNVNSG